MGVILSFLVGIILTIIVDKKCKSAAKISFAVLNFVIFAFMIFSTNDVLISEIVRNIMPNNYYDVVHESLNYKVSISIISYSTYNLLCLLVAGELFITIFRFSHVTSKYFYIELEKCLNLIKEKRIKISYLKINYKNSWFDRYISNEEKRYFLRC